MARFPMWKDTAGFVMSMRALPRTSRSARAS